MRDLYTGRDSPTGTGPKRLAPAAVDERGREVRPDRLARPHLPEAPLETPAEAERIRHPAGVEVAERHEDPSRRERVEHRLEDPVLDAQGQARPREPAED